MWISVKRIFRLIRWHLGSFRSRFALSFPGFCVYSLTMWRIQLLAAFLVLFAGAVIANEHQHGTVVAVHSTSQNRYVPGYAGGDGVVASPGVNVKDFTQVYRIETEKAFYELEGGRKVRFALGDDVFFRIDDDHKRAVIFISNAQKGADHKAFHLKVVGEELKSK